MTSTATVTVADLARVITGPVLTPDDPGYADEVTGFNLAHSPRPDVVVGAADADDVAGVREHPREKSR